MVNKVLLVGNLGADPEIRYTGEGTPVTNFKLATNDFYRDKLGESVKTVEWHKCTAWGRLAEVAAEYLTKGDKIFIEGKLKYSSFENSAGETIYYSYVHVVEMKFINVKGKAFDDTEIELPKGDVDKAPF